jgi:hypothetical protein
MKSLLTITALPLVLACRSGQPGDPPRAVDCGPPSGQLAQGASAEALVGEYRLRLVATSGSRPGASTDGHVRLRPADDTLRSPAPVLGIRDSLTVLPLRGAAELEAGAIGATVPGDPGSDDPRAPGVLVIERHSARPGEPPSIILRVGSDANRRDAVRFDGGFLALTVRGIDSAAFAGTWVSGGGGRAAKGYFCAERTAG